MPKNPEQARRDLDALEDQLRELRTQLAASHDPAAQKRLESISGLVDELRADLNSQLTAWQRVKLARHPQRPYFLDYAGQIFENVSEIHGDRNFGDDPAIVCAMVKLNGREVMAIGQQKGRTTKEN